MAASHFFYRGFTMITLIIGIVIGVVLDRFGMTILSYLKSKIFPSA